ncbi:ABC transporter ATP-binding protein [Calditerricola satsumensis]|uniref:ABC transporter ATP-binding protein n=1 Tax=Calditerricola satsumensis TaxID=373054 RepID=A0A8J3BF34_9BACI|nr:ATP-binding cassette domain-containing protein [Calditerricola satsumensis]GGK06052.1 ABC transporter ATP-binding protein [Calditerricola satsumensis]
MYRIEARNLTKTFKTHKSRPGLLGALRDLFTRQYTTITAVDGINLLVEEGEMVGYIGANGAGKSTTIKMLTGILMPTSGFLRVNGMDPHRERERFVRTIGVVFGQRSQLWWDLAVQESFRLLQRVYRVPDDVYRKHMGYVIEVLEIGDLLDRPVRKLSLGQRMRCELAAAFVHNPPLLFLDEPTIGLDVLIKMKVREFLREMNRTYGTTILLTTHDLSDIEALCSRVVMLDKGRILYDGSLEELRRRWAEEKRVVVEFARPVSVEDLHRQTADLPVTWEQEHPYRSRAVLRQGDGALVSSLLARLQAFPVTDVRVEETSTEEIVSRIYAEGMAHA